MKAAEKPPPLEGVHARCAPSCWFAFALVVALVLAVGCAPPALEPRTYDAELVLVTWPEGWVDEYSGLVELLVDGAGAGRLIDPRGCALELAPVNNAGRVSVASGICEWTEPDGAHVRLSWPEGEGVAREELHISMAGELVVWGDGWAAPVRDVDYVLEGR